MTTATQATRVSIHRLSLLGDSYAKSIGWRCIERCMVGAMMLGLAGCAGANVSNLTSSAPGTPPPSEILVEVGPYQAGTISLSQELATKIQATVVRRLTEQHITAEPYVPGTSHPGAAVLEIGVMEADPGSMPERFLVGFGFGKATLRVKADLVNADRPAARSVMAFNTSANSGSKPGLIVPAGAAVATGRVIGLAIGGALDVALNLDGGLDKPVRSTAGAIVGQLKTYYRTVGWQWPIA